MKSARLTLYKSKKEGCLSLLDPNSPAYLSVLDGRLHISNINSEGSVIFNPKLHVWHAESFYENDYSLSFIGLALIILKKRNLDMEAYLDNFETFRHLLIPEVVYCKLGRKFLISDRLYQNLDKPLKTLLKMGLYESDAKIYRVKAIHDNEMSALNVRNFEILNPADESIRNFSLKTAENNSAKIKVCPEKVKRKIYYLAYLSKLCGGNFLELCLMYPLGNEYSNLINRLEDYKRLSRSQLRLLSWQLQLRKKELDLSYKESERRYYESPGGIKDYSDYLAFTTEMKVKEIQMPVRSSGADDGEILQLYIKKYKITGKALRKLMKTVDRIGPFEAVYRRISDSNYQELIDEITHYDDCRDLSNYVKPYHNTLLDMGIPMPLIRKINKMRQQRRSNHILKGPTYTPISDSVNSTMSKLETLVNAGYYLTKKTRAKMYTSGLQVRFLNVLNRVKFEHYLESKEEMLFRRGRHKAKLLRQLEKERRRAEKLERKRLRHLLKKERARNDGEEAKKEAHEGN